MVIVSFIINILYLLLIGCFVYGFDKVKTFKLDNKTAKTTFSVIIPFRNEAENLPNLLASILKLNYPKDLFEVILVDDDSEDNSMAQIRQHITDNNSNIKIISNIRKTSSPKKDAITTAIIESKYEWIVTTDADCLLPKYWLDSFDGYIQAHNIVCLAAPVTYSDEQNFLGRFQLLNILSLQSATIGSFGISMPFLSNGANFVYKKKLFNHLNGFSGNTEIASGDDIFLLEKIAKLYPSEVHFLKCHDAIVFTKPQNSWDALINQQIRWAAKTSHYKNTLGRITAMTVLLMNTLLIGLFMFSILGLLNLKILLYCAVIKLYIDFLLIYKAAHFFNQKGILKHYFFGFFTYPAFSFYTGVLSLFKGYRWKGRTFKK